MIGNYTGREHWTASSGDPAPRRTRRTPVEQAGGYVSPTARRYAEMVQRQAEEAARDRYQIPQTREQLLAMNPANQNRTYLEHRDVYDRLMGHAPT